MALVDYPAFLLDLRGRLRERESWGRGQIMSLIDELEQHHRIREDADAAVIRRFGDHLYDCFTGILPAATSTPLTLDDRLAMSLAMDDGAPSDPSGGDACNPARQSSPNRTPAPALT